MSKPQVPKRDLQAKATREDLIHLVLQPLSRQMNQSWFHLLDKIKEVQDSIEIIAREIGRQKQDKELPSVDADAGS